MDKKPEFTVIDGGGERLPGTEYIVDVFGPGGMLAKQIPGYEPRPGQIALARAIDKGIRDRHHVIGEGPTGTGKSLAYAVPAAYHSVHSGRQFCIVTANKTLQGQIATKDLPTLQKAVGWPFTYAVRKGLNSYLCERDYRNGKWRDLLFDQDLKTGEDVQIEETKQWADATTTGDFEESPGPSPRVWSAFSTSRDGCDGRRCSEIKTCFVQKAKEASKEADIVITNYHLFYLHLRHVATGRPGWILPPFDVAILDEAHNAAGIAREFFGDEVTFGSLYRCVTNMHMYEVRGFKKRGAKLREAVLFETRRLWNAFGYRARGGQNLLKRTGDCDSTNLENLLGDCWKFYQDIANALEPANASASVHASAHAVEAETARQLAERCESVKAKLEVFRCLPTKDSNPNQRLVYYIEGSGQPNKEGKPQFVKLKSKALLVGGYLNNVLFDPLPTVVQTSATLAIRGQSKNDDFFYLKREMGMSKRDDVDELVVASPFDWQRQALLVIPEAMPNYQDSQWPNQVCLYFEQILNMVGGRTLGLFTSFKMLHMVRDYLWKQYFPFQIMSQGDATNAELQRRFREDIDSVLLGSQSFAEGVDIQGEACSCVVLDKLPFIPPNDPLLKGLEQFERNVFSTYQIPESIIAFKQRVGRLIRTVSDTGVIVVLDKRIHTKGYGKRFLDSIPPITVAKSIDAIPLFLQKVGAL
jgi:ATP-dependent DNA helicase DinG